MYHVTPEPITTVVFILGTQFPLHVQSSQCVKRFLVQIL